MPPNAWKVDAKIADITRSQLDPQIVTLETETKTLRVDLAKAAMLVIDMQNDFCHPDGWLAHIGVDVTPARTPINPLQNLLPKLRSQFQLFGLTGETAPICSILVQLRVTFIIPQATV